jgi:hypothetical protein
MDEVRSTGRTLGGVFREVESTGRKVRGVLRIRTGPGTTVGVGTHREHGTHVHTTAEDVKKQIRRVRPEELARLEQHDVEIADLEEQLKQARLRRAATAAEAWTKAHVVTVKELEALVNPDRPTATAYDEKTRQQVAAAHAEIRKAFSTGG